MKIALYIFRILYSHKDSNHKEITNKSHQNKRTLSQKIENAETENG